jgi:hypothetical protein
VISLPVLRFANGQGRPCNLLGELVRETLRHYIYRSRSGFEGFIPKRLVHLAPCPSCPDHRRSRFSHLARQSA